MIPRKSGDRIKTDRRDAIHEKVYETTNPYIAILGHFEHKRELLPPPH